MGWKLCQLLFLYSLRNKKANSGESHQQYCIAFLFWPFFSPSSKKHHKMVPEVNQIMSPSHVHIKTAKVWWMHIKFYRSRLYFFCVKLLQIVGVGVAKIYIKCIFKRSTFSNNLIILSSKDNIHTIYNNRKQKLIFSAWKKLVVFLECKICLLSWFCQMKIFQNVFNLI